MTHFHLTLRKTDCWAQRCSSVVQHSGMEAGGGGDQEFKDILSYIASWRSTWSTWKIVSKKRKYTADLLSSLLLNPRCYQRGKHISKQASRREYRGHLIKSLTQRSHFQDVVTTWALSLLSTFEFSSNWRMTLEGFFRQLDQNQELSYYKRLRQLRL